MNEPNLRKIEGNHPELNSPEQIQAQNLPTIAKVMQEISKNTRTSDR